MAVIEITRNMRDALIECASYQRRSQDYWWRVASMKKLAELGYVELCAPERARRNGYTGKASVYRPTPLGLDYLSGLP